MPTKAGLVRQACTCVPGVLQDMLGVGAPQKLGKRGPTAFNLFMRGKAAVKHQGHMPASTRPISSLCSYQLTMHVPERRYSSYA